MFNKIVKKFFFIFISMIILIITMSSTIAFADTTEKSNLQIKLEGQEDKLKNDIGDLAPKDDNTIEKSTDTIMNAKYGEFNGEKKSKELLDLVKTGIIKSRTFIIYAYALYVAGLAIYISTIGSRSINRRRHGLLSLKWNTIVFLMFINAPLVIIYFSALKSNIANFSIYNIFLGGIEFLRTNSFIIFVLIAYLGITKLIISKNDLPTRIQGKYLIKASFILLIFLNLIPICISFIIVE